MDDNQDLVMNVGVGIGTFILVVLVVTVVFVVVVMYLSNRARRKRELLELGRRTTKLDRKRAQRSIVSPKTPNSAATTTTTKLPSKQCNVKKTNKVQNNNRPQSVNPSQSVNEFVAELEVYDLGQVSVHRSKRVKMPPDSTLLKGEPFTLEGYQMDSLKMGQNGSDPEVSYKQKFMNKDGKYHDSSTSVVTEIELEGLGETTATGETMETNEKELILEATESLTRSCLSSSLFVVEPEVYDLGQVSVHRSKRVKMPPDSPLLKGEPFTLEGYQMDSLKMGQNGSDPKVSSKQKFMNKGRKYHDSSTSVVTEIELEGLGETTATGETMETNEKELMLEATESLTRSCLSSSSFVVKREVYDLGQVSVRRSNRVKMPPDSPLLKGEPFTLEGYQMDSLKMGQNGSDPKISSKQKFMNKGGKYHDSSTSVVTEIELESLGETTATGETMETKEKELMLEATESLPCSCLSSSSDPSHGKLHRKRVTFSEDTSSRKRESSEDMTPPLPLPPRYETFKKRKHGLCIVRM